MTSRKSAFLPFAQKGFLALPEVVRFYGVMVSTQDSESCDPSSNLGGTLNIFKSYFLDLNLFIWHYFEICFIRGRDSSVGRALD